tara:strand:+ start:1750 stop:3006 length:1257 start_codon:yes stop_codon:yes gene_type:complete
MPIYALPSAKEGKKPLVDIEIDHTHPYAKGLVFAQYFEGFNRHTLTSQRPVVVGASSSIDEGGLGLQGTQSLATFSNRRFSTIKGSAVFDYENKVTISEALFGKFLITTDAEWQIGKGGTAGEYIVQINNDSSSFNGMPSTTNTLGHHTISATWDANINHRSLKIDDTLKELTTAITATEGAVTDLHIGNRPSLNRGTRGKFKYVLMYDYEISEEQMDALHRNPYQILKPKTPPVYFVPSAAGGNTLTADSGSYAYTGTDAELQRGLVMSVDSGSYTYTGTAAALTFTPVGNFTLTADAGAYTYTGTNAGLIADRVLIASSGGYTYTGTVADLNLGFVLSADTGAYTYTGTNIGFVQQRILTAISGAYVYNGTNANLTFTPVAPDVPVADGVTVSGTFGNGVAFTASFGNGVTTQGKL